MYNRRFKPERAHYIRPEMVEQRDAESTAVAYLYTGGHGQPVAICFSGKRQKPDQHYRYRTEERRAEAVQAFFANVRSRERYQVERREEVKKAARAAASLAIPADGYMSAPAVAAWARQCLKEAFPGVKFSVTSDRSLRVRWTDGPTRDQVESIANSFAGSYFDGMIDLEGSIYHAIDGNRVRFGASYVFTERTMSLEALEAGARAAEAHYKTNQPAAVIEQGAYSVDVKPNPDFPGAVEGRWPGEYELVTPDSRVSRTLGATRVLEAWHDEARPFAMQPSPTFERITVLGTDGYGNTALPAADGGETGRCYPRPSEPPEAEAARDALEKARADLREEIARGVKHGETMRTAAEALAEICTEPREVFGEIIDFAPHLAAHIARAEAAKRIN